MFIKLFMVKMSTGYSIPNEYCSREVILIIDKPGIRIALDLYIWD